MALQYIGARYVIKIYENKSNPSTAEWDANVNYEPLVMVTYNFGSYLSKKHVPATVGNPADNPAYWTQTGFYNGQIAQLMQDVQELNESLSNEINTRSLQINDVNNRLSSEVNSLKDKDIALQNNITIETNTRKSEDLNLSNRIYTNTGDITALSNRVTNEATARTNADAYLQEQIDEIIAPSGEAPSAAEVENARIGANGVTYNTLGNAIRGQITEVGTEINEVWNSKYNINGVDDGILVFESGQYDSTGTDSANAKRLRTPYVDAKKYGGLLVTCASSTATQLSISFWETKGSERTSVRPLATSDRGYFYFNFPSDANYFRLLTQRSENYESVDVSEFTFILIPNVARINNVLKKSDNVVRKPDIILASYVYNASTNGQKNYYDEKGALVDYIPVKNAKVIGVKTTSKFTVNMFAFDEALNLKFRYFPSMASYTDEVLLGVDDNIKYVMPLIRYANNSDITDNNYLSEMPNEIEINFYTESGYHDIVDIDNIKYTDIAVSNTLVVNANGNSEIGTTYNLDNPPRRGLEKGYITLPNTPILIVAKSGYEIEYTSFDRFFNEVTTTSWANYAKTTSKTNKEKYFRLKVKPTGETLADTSITVDDIVTIDVLNQSIEEHIMQGYGARRMDIAVSGSSDHTFVGDELWFFPNNSTDDHTTWSAVKRYAVDIENGTSEYLGSFNHNWGHCNTVDYCSANNCLVVGNGSGNSNIGNNQFYIFENASNMKNEEEVNVLTDAIIYDLGEWGSAEYGKQVNVIWGSENRGKFNVVYVMSNDGKYLFIREVLLGLGSHELEDGTFISGKNANQFNGTFKVLNLYTYTYSDYACLQGGTCYNGRIIMGIAHDGIQIEELILDENNIKCRRHHERIYTDDGVEARIDTEGLAIKDGLMFIGTYSNTYNEFRCYAYQLNSIN